MVFGTLLLFALPLLCHLLPESDLARCTCIWFCLLLKNYRRFIYKGRGRVKSLYDLALIPLLMSPEVASEDVSRCSHLLIHRQKEFLLLGQECLVDGNLGGSSLVLLEVVKFAELLFQLVLMTFPKLYVGCNVRLHRHNLGREFGYFWKVVSLS